MKSVHTDSYRSALALLVGARKRAKMSQQALAARLGKPQSFVSKFENAERRLDIAEYFEIAMAIGSDPLELVAQILGTKVVRRSPKAVRSRLRRV